MGDEDLIDVNSIQYRLIHDNNVKKMEIGSFSGLICESCGVNHSLSICVEDGKGNDGACGEEAIGDLYVTCRRCNSNFFLTEGYKKHGDR